MDNQTLETAIKLSAKIEESRIDYNKIKRTQLDDFKEREAWIGYNGSKCDKSDFVTIPSNVFKIVCKLILVEHQQKLLQLEEEFKNL